VPFVNVITFAPTVVPLAFSIALLLWFVGSLVLVALIIAFFMVQKQEKERQIDFMSTRQYEFGVLIGLRGPLKGERFPVVRSGLTIGREETTCDVVIKAANISREHSRIFLIGEQPVIADLHSKNGTFVNDEYIIQHELKDGDIISFGRKHPISFEFKVQ